MSEPACDELVGFARRHRALDLERDGELDLEVGAGGELDRLRSEMEPVRGVLEDGIGFVVLDRLPVEALSVSEHRVAAWAVFSCIGRVVDQKLTGSKVYDVRDQGVSLAHGVRRSVTNLAQELHTDAGWLEQPPEYVGLACQQPSQRGGLNRVSSLATVYNGLAERSPELLSRLQRPFWWDRQAEHRPDEPPASERPVYYRVGERVHARYYDDYIRKGHALMDTPIDEPGERALELMRTLINAPELGVEFGLRRGEFLILNNRRVAHSRSAFEDGDAARPTRHYFRLWSRRAGSTRLEG